MIKKKSLYVDKFLWIKNNIYLSGNYESYLVKTKKILNTVII